MNADEQKDNKDRLEQNDQKNMELPKAETDFLKEKIKERPINKRKLLKRTMVTAGLAVVFGLVACVTFSLLEPVISKSINPEETAQVVTFPEETEEVDPQDMAVDEEQLQIIQEEASEETSAEDQSAETSETDETESEVNAKDNYIAAYDAVGELADESKKYLVTVTSVKSDTSWINETLQDQDETSGLILANNGKELLILVSYEELDDADSILVTFYTNEQDEAVIKEVDQTTGLAVIAIELSDLGKNLLDSIEIASLGSSVGTNLVGQPVVAVGSPSGVSNSVYYGMITSQDVPIGLVDTNYMLLTTDIYGSTKASGVLINMQGQIVGIIYNGYDNEDMPNQLNAIGISELKNTIEKLSNEEKMTYFGIHGTEVNTSLRVQYDMPYGAYITSIDMDSPAMRAGIQSGDIITQFDGKDIVSYSDLIGNLMELHADQEIEITLERQQGNEYQEMTVSVYLALQDATD